MGGAGGLLDNLTTHRSKVIPLYCVAKDEPLEIFNKLPFISKIDYFT